MQDRLIAEADALTPDNLYDVFTWRPAIPDSCSSQRRWPASSTNRPLKARMAGHQRSQRRMAATVTVPWKTYALLSKRVATARKPLRAHAGHP